MSPPRPLPPHCHPQYTAQFHLVSWSLSRTKLWNSPKMPVQPKTSRFFYFFYRLQFLKPRPINLIKEACKHISSLNFKFKFLKRYKPKNTPYTFLIVKKGRKKRKKAMHQQCKKSALKVETWNKLWKLSETIKTMHDFRGLKKHDDR